MPFHGNIIDPENERTTALQAIIPGLVPNEFQKGEWYFDIATTVSARIGGPDGAPACLMVDSQMHPEIINYFTEWDIAQCNCWVRDRTGGYQRDEVAHIPRFSNLRIQLDEPGDSGAVYVQVYTTEKTVTYHPDGLLKAKRTNSRLVLKQWEVEEKLYFRPLAEAFFHASATHPVAVRFESRVPYECYPYVHLAFTWRELEPWLFCIKNSYFWGYKWRKLLAYWNVLELICTSEQARSRFSLNRLPEVGSLVHLIVYMTNALVNRPDEGGHFDEVHDAGCVQRLVRNRLLPYTPLGYYALHSLIYPNDPNKHLPRISSLRTISKRTIVYLFAQEAKDRNELAVLELFRKTKKRNRDDQPDGDPWGAVDVDVDRRVQPHVPNKQRRVVLSLLEPAPDVFAEALPEQDIHETYSSEEEDEEAREEAPRLSQQVADLVYTYPLQIFAKVPNKTKGRGSWCNLDELERTEVNVDLFMDSSSPDQIFTSYTDCGRHSSRWDSTVSALFPTLSEKRALGTIQGLSTMSVWDQWETMLSYLSPESEQRTVAAVRNYVSAHWRWLPYYTKRKLWVTGRSLYHASQTYRGPEVGGPWIVFNPRPRR